MAYTRVLFRRDTAAQWEVENPTLMHGEMGLVVDCLGQDMALFKLGDGETAWKDLPYASGPAGPAGEDGRQGDQGPEGQEGPAGAQGNPGDKGDKGDSPPISDSVISPDSNVAASSLAVKLAYDAAKGAYEAVQGAYDAAKGIKDALGLDGNNKIGAHALPNPIKSAGNSTATAFQIADGTDLAQIFGKLDAMSLGTSGSGSYVSNVTLSTSQDGKTATLTQTKGTPGYCSYCGYCGYCSYCSYCNNCASNCACGNG